jgi:carbon-monoxide dehydrogenase large subunit
MKRGTGTPVGRIEDERFVTGAGRFVDDIDLPDQAFAVLVRSSQAHARLGRVSTGAAASAPGVLGVFTAGDLAADGVGTLPCQYVIANRDGSPMAMPPRPALAQDRVRHVGEAIALVVARTLPEARDAAELVEVECETLPPVTDLARALEPGAPQLHAEAPGNLVLDWEAGDNAAVERLFASAHWIVSLDLVNNRVIANPIEPRAAIGDFDPATGRYTLYTGNQGAFVLRNMIAEEVLKVDRARLRVVTPDVGGSFGMKIFVYPEQVLVTWAAGRLGVPVKWTGDRAESFLADAHARDHLTQAQLALDYQGRMLALRARTIANLGAYLSQESTFIPTLCCSKMHAGVYTIEAAHFSVRCALTNTAPVDAYRGAGQPEAIYVVERLVDAAARELGIDPAELRRRNLISPDAMPYRTAMGHVYDSGNFATNLDRALELAEYEGLPERKRRGRAQGKLRGLGICCYGKLCGGATAESARVEVSKNGRIRLLIGTQSNGQGQETAYGQILADALGVELDAIQVLQGDTDVVGWGRGTGGSWSLLIGGSAARRATEEAIEKGRAVAASALEAAAADIAFTGGRYVIRGTDRSVGLLEVAAHAGEAGLSGDGRFASKAPSLANGAHLCEVEIDEATGAVAIVGYTAVDDFGTLLNPTLAAGQLHGGIVQGIGQALLEHAVYDPGSGQLISGSFMDYAMPRAHDLPPLGVELNEVPSPTNPLGAKGVGEAGAVAAPPAVINAIVDALAEHGVRHLDMPATPATIWQVIEKHAAPGRKAGLVPF